MRFLDPQPTIRNQDVAYKKANLQFKNHTFAKSFNCQAVQTEMGNIIRQLYTDGEITIDEGAVKTCKTEIRNIILQCADGEVTIDEEAAALSNLIKTELNEKDGFVVSLPKVDVKVMKKVICWANFYKDVDEPLYPIEWCSPSQHVKDFNSKFFEISDNELEDLFIAAHYLRVEGLYTECCKRIAALLKKCKSAEEIRELFGFTDDLTEEEKEDIPKCNPWSSKFDPKRAHEVWGYPYDENEIVP